MSKRIYAVVYNNGQVDAWSTNQGPPAMPYVPECEVTSEIDRLNEEVKEAEARGFKNGMLHAADKQQSQLRLLADAVLDNHTNCCDACPEGDIHACSGFAIIGVVNCCQCEACKIAREVQSE